MTTVAVVGAGLAGVAAAQALSVRDIAVTMFDRGGSPGGRCSSRHSPAGPFDHGAQYFTARDPRFSRVVAGLEKRGAVQSWGGRIVDLVAGKPRARDDGETRYVGIPDMRAVVHGAAGALDITCATRIASAQPSAHGWALADETGFELGEYDALILAMPAEQARPLVPAGSTLVSTVRTARSAPCWALMIAFEAALPLDFDGAFVEHPDIAWLARDSSKPGRPDGERWVVHATATWSAAHLTRPADEVAALLRASFFAAVDLPPVAHRHAEAHRWALARPAATRRPGICWDADLRLALCGDWCLGPRLEDAYLSGLGAAQKVTHALLPRRRSTVA